MIAPRRLLIANDDQVLASMLARAVANKLRGCAIECVGSFEAALDSMEHHPSGAVLIDLSMGGPRCADVVRTLRASRWGSELVIIGMTGDRCADYRRQLCDVGVDDCLAGPCDAEKLVQCLTRIATPRGMVASNR